MIKAGYVYKQHEFLVLKFDKMLGLHAMICNRTNVMHECPHILSLHFMTSGEEKNDKFIAQSPRFLCKFCCLTQKIRTTICLHDSSEIIARMQNFFSCHLPVVKRQRFFNASYSFHVYLIELMFDVDYRS